MRCASARSRAAGVMIVRSPITILRSNLMACRTSSSQTNDDDRAARLHAGASRARPSRNERAQLPRHRRGIESRRWAPRPDDRGRPAGASRPGAAGRAGHAAADGRPQLVGQALDVQQVPRRDVVRRDVAAPAAAAERHRRIEPVVRPIEPCVVGVFTTMRKAGFFRPNSRMTCVVPRVDRHGVAHAAIAQDLDAALAALPPVGDDVVREHRDRASRSTADSRARRL